MQPILALHCAKVLYALQCMRYLLLYYEIKCVFVGQGVLKIFFLGEPTYNTNLLAYTNS